MATSSPPLPHPRSPPPFTPWTVRSLGRRRRRRRCGVIKLDVQDKGRNIGDPAAAAAAVQSSNMDRVDTGCRERILPGNESKSFSDAKSLLRL